MTDKEKELFKLAIHYAWSVNQQGVHNQSLNFTSRKQLARFLVEQVSFDVNEYDIEDCCNELPFT